MTSTSLAVEPPSTYERCCRPGQCVYRPEMVDSYLGYLRGARARGEDPTAAQVLARGGEEMGRTSGVSTSLDIRKVGAIWDVERMLAQGKLMAREISQALCPFALDDDDCQAS